MASGFQSFFLSLVHTQTNIYPVTQMSSHGNIAVNACFSLSLENPVVVFLNIVLILEICGFIQHNGYLKFSFFFQPIFIFSTFFFHYWWSKYRVLLQNGKDSNSSFLDDRFKTGLQICLCQKKSRMCILSSCENLLKLHCISCDWLNSHSFFLEKLSI